VVGFDSIRLLKEEKNSNNNKKKPVTCFPQQMGDERFLFYGWSHILISGVRR